MATRAVFASIFAMSQQVSTGTNDSGRQQGRSKMKRFATLFAATLALAAFRMGFLKP